MLGDKMYPYFNEYLRSIVVGKRIENEDVRAIRCVLDEELAADRDIIEALIALDCTVQGGAEWQEFLGETISDFVVWVEGPLGRVTAETSAWLIAALSGRAAGSAAPNAASILHAVIAEAEEVDTSLTVFAMSAPCSSAGRRISINVREDAARFVM